MKLKRVLPGILLKCSRDSVTESMVNDVCALGADRYVENQINSYFSLCSRQVEVA